MLASSTICSSQDGRQGQGIPIRLQTALQYCLEGSMCVDQVGECNVVQGKLVLALE